MKKISKTGIISTIVIALVVLALLNVCTFVIPFSKVSSTVLFTVYGCTTFIVVIEALLILFQLFGNEEGNQKIISLPIIFYGCVSAIVQLVATVIFYALNAFIQIPFWSVILVECIIFAFGTIQIIKGFFFKEKNAEYHKNKANTEFMDSFRAKLKTLSAINKDDSVKKELNDLLDLALGSDPVSSTNTSMLENELSTLIDKLNESIKNGSSDKNTSLIEETREKLIERNSLCKLSK